MSSPSKINVLFIQSQVAFGADSRVHADIMRYLDRDRFTVHVACVADDGGRVPKSLAGLREIPNIHVRPTRFAPGISQRSLATILAGVKDSASFPVDLLGLLRYVQKENIHVLHGTEKPRDGLYAVALARLARAKSVVHVHVKWSNEYSKVARWAVRHASAVFSISNYVTDTIVQMGTPPERIFTLHNCLDASRWNPSETGSAVRKEFGISAGTPLLLSVSRLFSWKGQRELVRAVASVRDEFPDVKLLIVGWDEPTLHGGSFIKELQELAQSLGVSENVVCTGPRDDVAQLMAAADLYTMPSYEEPFGIVFLEAMAMKKPVIAVNNGGTPEVVEHGRAGLLSPPWDVDALASNIRVLLRDPEKRRAFGEYGRARALEYFNPQRLAAEAGEAYTAILNR